MAIVVVHPGASFATHDVYVGVVAGLRANGALTHEARLDSVLAWYQAAIGRGVAAGRFLPDLQERAAVVNQGGEGGLNVSAFASAPITRGILLIDPRPDWALVVSGTAYNVADVGILRRAGIRTALLCTESPYFAGWETAIGRHYDVVFTNDRACVAPYRAAGLNAHYLPPAYHPAIHTPEGPAEGACDVRFVGSLFGERKRLFEQADLAGLDARLGGLDPDAPHAEAVRGVVPNERTAALYRGAKIVLNPHRTTAQHGDGGHIAPGSAESVGPRAYEIAACGAFQLMDDGRPEARELFGAALATYREGDAADLARQVRRWAADDAGREAMAQAQHEAILPHSWPNRARELLGILDYDAAAISGRERQREAA